MPSIGRTGGALWLILMVVGCTRGAEPKAPAELGVAKPWRQKVEHDRSYVAQIKAIRHIEIRAFEKGYVQGIFADEGQTVKKGQKLFQVMPMLLQAELDRSKAEYDASDIEYGNTKHLYAKKVVSKSELALTKAKLTKGKATLDIAQAHLNLSTVSAPFDGILDRFRVRLGSLVEEGELMTTLSDISQLLVYFNVSERDYLNLMGPKKTAGESTPLGLVLANGETYNQMGKLDTIEADFDSDTGNVALRATFPNPDRRLRHGETGNVTISDTLNNALVIPQKATFDVLDKRYVYVVDDHGAVQPREIKVEREVPHLFVVKTGLTEADAVLLEGLGKVNKGEVIKAVLRAPAAVMKSLDLVAH